eukprot:TRINITY_DN3190_c2_g1_i1.p1 TRINITY_DN3190_c2_g1~~TRINITY_DN3190_c2_g1_i1.p1  ORF type:complete len:317 (-),score=118.30 TRINITY_DN3190_c2_g1_i1:76-1026(-)
MSNVTFDFNYFFAGGLAGSVAAVCTCPFEVVKIRLQATKNKEILTSSHIGTFKLGTGTLSSIRDLYRAEGLFSLWRGIGPSLLGVIPARSIWFGTYRTTRDFLEKKFGSNSRVDLVSALIAGCTVTTITCPIWLVKTRMQLQSSLAADAAKNNYNGLADCVRRIAREEGIKGFYKGLAASYLGVCESSLQLVLYEELKRTLIKRKIKKLKNIQPSNKIELHHFEYLVLAGSSKLAASILTYPHEVIRTRLREQRGDVIKNNHKYKGLIQGLKLIAKEEGRIGLYSGMGAHLMRTVPSAAIMFVTFEATLSFFNNRK